jgi:hypothetical protein
MNVRAQVNERYGEAIRWLRGLGRGDVGNSAPGCTDRIANATMRRHGEGNLRDDFVGIHRDDSRCQIEAAPRATASDTLAPLTRKGI